MLRNVYIGTIRPHLEYGSTILSSASKSAIYTLDKVQNQALRLITGSMKSTPMRVVWETTAIQPPGRRGDMRNACKPRGAGVHLGIRWRRVAASSQGESFIHENNNLKKTYNNNSNKTVQCTYSSPPMSSEHTNRSLTVRATILTVTRDQWDTSKNFSRSHTLMNSARRLHGYMCTLMSPLPTQYRCWKFDLSARHLNQLHLQENIARTTMPK